MEVTDNMDNSIHKIFLRDRTVFDRIFIYSKKYRDIQEMLEKMDILGLLS
jgi:hypothetical protein